MKETTRAKVKKMRRAGHTFEEIGRVIKRSRQRAHQIWLEIEKDRVDNFLG